MDFWDGVGKGADEQWEFEHSMRGGGGGCGCGGWLLKGIVAFLIIWWIIDLVSDLT